EFVLRGFILCEFCKHPMTASWSRGRSKRFRYYRCAVKSCVRRDKSVNADIVDERFKNLLRCASPKAGALRLAKEIVVNLWSNKVKDFEGHQGRLEREIAETRRQVDLLLGRIVKTVDEKIAAAYEAQISKYQKEGEVLQEKLKKLGETTVSFETALEVNLKCSKTL